jgi:broad specificity phosphatase PhoE
VSNADPMDTDTGGKAAVSAPLARRVGPSSVVLVRHASTAWTKLRKHTGRTDVPLDSTGRAEAAALTQRLALIEATRVLSSPLSRALETCRLSGLGDAVEECDLLLEWDYGDYEGMTTAEISRLHPRWNLFRDGCPGGEDATDVGRRADALIEMLFEDPPGGVVVCFAHGHLLRVLAARWVELEPEAGALFALGAPSVSELGFEHDVRVVHVWNT